MSETSRECDVLVIGGGPGGSTAAALLAERGHRVVLLEKARHPRFHIGESLLPANLPILDRLGVGSEIRAVGMEKWAAEFVSPDDGRRQEFRFSQAWDKSLPMAYQVRRSEFDHILIRRAAQFGAEVFEGCRAREVNLGPAERASEPGAAPAAPGSRGARVTAELDGGGTLSVAADYVIDASGRDTLLGNRLGLKRRNPAHNSAALYAHFAGARRNDGLREGNITIYWFEHGWFWFIPLADGATSVGAVVWPRYMRTRTGEVRDFFLRTIESCPPLAERLRDASLITGVEATGNYSYACAATHGTNFLLVGDAYSFIDPVFSTGVMLAMNGAVAAADAVHTCLAAPGDARRALARYDRIARHGPEQFSWFIYRVTNPTMREMFLDPKNVLRVEEALLSVLAGDIFGRTPIWGRLRVFKALYYLISFLNLRRTWRARARRAENIRSDPKQLTGV